MSNTEDQKAAEEYGLEHFDDMETTDGEHFLAGCTHIRSTVVAPLEAKLAEVEGAIELSKDEYVRQVGAWKIIQRLEAQLSEAQRVIKDFREALQFYKSGSNWYDNDGDEGGECRAICRSDLHLFSPENWVGGKHATETLALHPAPSEEKAE